MQNNSDNKMVKFNTIRKYLESFIHLRILSFLLCFFLKFIYFVLFCVFYRSFIRLRLLKVVQPDDII